MIDRIMQCLNCNELMGKYYIEIPKELCQRCHWVCEKCENEFLKKMLDK
jgi:hypothetical protein